MRARVRVTVRVTVTVRVRVRVTVRVTVRVRARVRVGEELEGFGSIDIYCEAFYKKGQEEIKEKKK